MILLKWYREWIEIRATLKQAQVCESCETLKHQLEISNISNKQLLDRLLEKPEPIIEREPAQITRPMHNIPWNVRRQMLEAEDRRKAELLRNAPKPDAETEKKETEVFEAELKDAEQRRTQQTAG